jgi:homoserine dehydrogenase
LRLNVLDEPGVMAQVSTILSKRAISIEALIQKDVANGEVPIVIITNEVQEQALNEAIARLEGMPKIQSKVTRIRVASF